jgi:hypothetical protein
MCLRIHGDSYLSGLKAKSRSSGFNCFSDFPTEPTATPDPEATPPPENGAIHVHPVIMKAVLSSAADAKTDAVFFNCKEGITLRRLLQL